MSRVVFLGGRSGSGKTVLAAKLSVPVLSLDAFFRPLNPDLPTWLGEVDWNHLDCYDTEAAKAAVQNLLGGRTTDIPEYDLVTDRLVGTTVMSVGPGGFVAEGVFAPAVLDALLDDGNYGQELRLIVLEVSLTSTIVSKVRRDVSEGRLGLARAFLTALRSSARCFEGQAAWVGAPRCSRADGPDRIQRLLVGEPT